MWIDLNSLLLGIAVVVNFGLSAFILFKDKKNSTNIAFALLLFFIALWVFCFLLILRVKSPEFLLLLRRMTPASSALIASFFFWFTVCFPIKKEKIGFWQRLLIFSPGIFFAVVSVFSPFLIQSFVIFNENFPFIGEAEYGPLYIIYAIYFISYFIAGLFNLFRMFFINTGRLRLQIFYVLFGLLVAGLGGILFSLILPLLGVSHIFIFGPIFSVFPALFITYAISRYRLLDINDFFSHGVLFFACSLAIIGTLVFILNDSPHFILPFYIFLANLFLGLLILFYGPEKPSNRLFCAIALCLATWNVSIFFIRNSIDSDIIFLWRRIAYLSVSFIPALFAYFVAIYVKPDIRIEKSRKIFFYLPIIVFPVLIFLNYIVIPNSSVYPFHEPGLLYPLFFIYVLGYFIFSFYEFIKKYQESRGINRLQMRYLGLGFFLSLIIALTTNLLLPALGIVNLNWVGPNATIILVGFIAYAIVRHRLMSTEIVIQKGLIYTVITSLIVTLYTLITLFSLEYFKNLFGVYSIITTVFTAMAIAVFYQPLVGFLQTVTDRWFFRRRYDYQKAMLDLSRAITTKIRLQELAGLVSTTFLENLNPMEISFLTRDSDKKRFRSVPLAATEKTSRYKRIEINLESSVIRQLEAKKEILVMEEMEDELLRMEGVRSENQEKMILLKENVAEMHRLGMSVWVPIILKESLIGIILMGPKVSGEIFTSEDLSLISTMSGQIAVALENARLYDHVVGIMNYHQDILDAMTSGVLTCDERGTILTFNPMLEKMIGISGKEAIGKNFSEIFKSNPAIKEVVLNSLKGHAYMNFEKDLLGIDGQKIPVSFSTTRLKDQEGKRIGILLTVQDQAEIKELEGRLRRQDKLAALGTMAAGMAHEIKNPLSAMKVLSQLFPLKGTTEDYRKKFEEIMPREIGRIDRIVESLLSFAKASTPQFKDADIVKIIDTLLDYYAEKMRENSVVLVREINPVPKIWADPEQLDKVFSNLILNAIQAMPQGGTLKVSLREGVRKDGELKNIYIDISDTGYGISKEAMKKLFDPFYTTKHGGTGLGLTITHSIIEGHGGTIDVSSEVNKGTTFAISLPIKQNVI